MHSKKPRQRYTHTNSLSHSLSRAQAYVPSTSELCTLTLFMDFANTSPTLLHHPTPKQGKLGAQSHPDSHMATIPFEGQTREPLPHTPNTPETTSAIATDELTTPLQIQHRLASNVNLRSRSPSQFFPATKCGIDEVGLLSSHQTTPRHFPPNPPYTQRQSSLKGLKLKSTSTERTKEQKGPDSWGPDAACAHAFQLPLARGI